jgi:hypothetical protein
VKSIIEHYYLDGVNLWDDDSKYGKAGMSAMNTTSYPKLIKALREALPDKLLTLVDKGDATEYLYDVNKNFITSFQGNMATWQSTHQI